MKTKKFNWNDIFIITILAAAIVGTCFHISSHLLIARSAKELADSAVYYWKSLCSFEQTIPNNDVSFLKYDEGIIRSVLPIVPEEFGYKFLSTFELLVNKDYFVISWNSFAHFINRLTYWILLLGLPIILIYWFYYTSILFAENDKPQEKQSLGLRCYLKIRKFFIMPIFTFLKDSWNKFKSKKYYFWPGLILILYNLNVISMVLIALSWYLYFVMSLDLASIYHVVAKLVICITPLLMPIFWPLWVLFIIWIIEKIKIKLGYNKLEDLYDKNDDFVDSLGIVTGIYGAPGVGKNQTETGIITQIECNMRRKAAKDMMEIRLEFPDFPFRKLEERIEMLKDSGKCVNKIQIKYTIQDILKKGKEFDYDFKHKKNEHYDELKVRSIEDELLDYSMLYFIYISALICSTYSLRSDKGIMMTGHFPSLGYDFFHRDLRDESLSERSKIFDLNLLRLLKQKNEENQNKAAEEFISLFDGGIIALSEFGKDRGNRYSNQSRANYETKPSNDGTAACFGVFRHLTTVRNHQYGFIVWDEQKLSAFSNAEAAMAEKNIYIGEQNNNYKMAIPGFFMENTLISWCREHYVNQVDKYIKTRNDQTLYSYFYLRIAGFFNNLSRKINNIFGYRRLEMILSGANINGAQTSKGDKGFFLLNKIVFSDRYQTDCYSGFFDTLKLQAKKGINQLDSYSGRVASPSELLKTNGYFTDELILAIQEYIERNNSYQKGRGKKK